MSTKDLSAVPVLAKDNYQTWARKIDGYFRLNGLYSLVHGTSLRPADTEADAQLKWDDRQMQAAGAITMSIDDSNAVHVRGKEGDPVEMWTKLDSIHNSKSASTRFNAMDSLFSIAKENNENLASMMTRIAAVMQRVQALRPTDSTEAYSLNTLDDELVIMAMLRGLPDDYQHLRSSLLCQQKLTRTMVEQAFVAEDNHRHHHERNQAIALRASTHQPYTHPRTNRHKPTAADRTPGATCGYCGKRNHTEAQCFAKADATHHKAHAAANIANATNEVPNAMAANAPLGQ